MKRKILFVLLVFAVLAGFGEYAHAAVRDYTVTLDSFSVAGDTTAHTGNVWPHIASNGKIKHITLTNSGATVQTVEFYDTTTTTNTITKIATYVLASTGTLPIPLNDDRNINLPFTSGLKMKKSAAGSIVTATLLYE